jgi:hypothetical protein
MNPQITQITQNKKQQTALIFALFPAKVGANSHHNELAAYLFTAGAYCSCFWPTYSFLICVICVICG